MIYVTKIRILLHELMSCYKEKIMAYLNVISWVIKIDEQNMKEE